MRLCGQGVNGTAALYQQREKSNEGVTGGPLRSEKEALLLGKLSPVCVCRFDQKWMDLGRMLNELDFNTEF